jgi:hypothetical protein
MQSVIDASDKRRKATVVHTLPLPVVSARHNRQTFKTHTKSLATLEARQNSPVLNDRTTDFSTYVSLQPLILAHQNLLLVDVHRLNISCV